MSNPKRVTRLLTAAIITLAGCHPTDLSSPPKFSPPKTSLRSLDPGCAPVAPISPSSDVGLNVHAFWDDQLPQLVRYANVGWVRVDVEWRQIQDSGPTTWNWTSVDPTMTRAYCNGLNVLGTLNYTPALASTAPSGDPEPTHYPPRDSTDWINFVTATVSRYPWVRYWTILNEPNFIGFYNGTPQDYANLVRWAALPIRANPDGQGRRYLVAGELSQDSTGIWVDALLHDPVQAANIDIVSFHTYGDSGAGAITSLANLTNNYSWSGDVWLTETDVTGCHANPDVNFKATPTCVDVAGVQSTNISTRNYIDDGIQAAYVDSMIAQMRRSSTRWKKTFFYDATSEVEEGQFAEDYGVLGGFLVHAPYGKRAYYRLGAAAAVTPSVSVSGPSSLTGGDIATYTASPITGGHPGSYYYEWRYKCTPRGSPRGGCDGGETIWDEGWDMTSVNIDAPAVDGTAILTLSIRETELDSPVTHAYAAKASTKFSISRF